MNNPSWTEEMFCVRFPYIPLAKFLSFHRAKKTSRDGSRFLIDRCYENKQFAQTFPGTYLTRVKARFIADIKSCSCVVYEFSLKIIYPIYSE